MLRACFKIGRGPAARDIGRGRGGEVRASPQWAVRTEPTKPPGKRATALRVFAEKADCLRCFSVPDRWRVCSFVAPRQPAFSAKTGPRRILKQALRLRHTRFAGAGIVFRVLALLSVAFLGASCSSSRESSVGVQLVLNTDDLAPSSTFELRFDAPVVSAEKVGQTATPSPLAISPPVAGTFTWLSTRSGVFTPSEALALNRSYLFTLRAGLRDPAGHSGRARLNRTLRTPPFTAMNATPSEYSSRNASAEPIIKLQFNANVSASAASPFMSFRDQEGNRVAANVRQADTDDYFQIYPNSPLSWQDQFSNARENSGTEEPSTDLPDNLATNAPPGFPHRLVAWPAHPLSPGRAWKLVLAKGLPARDDDLRLPQNFEVLIGDVRPFEITKAQANNIINRGKTLTLAFSKQVSTNLNATNFTEWISVAPAVNDLTADVSWNQLVLHGDFALHRPYTLTVQRGLPSAQPFRLEATWTNQFTFDIIPPRLYFPAFASDQLSGGNRDFKLLALNVPQFELRAKLLDRQTLIYALRGYHSYFKRHRGQYDWLEPYNEVDYDVVPGRTIYRKELRPKNETDVAETIPLRWDTILGDRKQAAIFLSAESVSGDYQQRKRLGTETLIQLTDLGLLWKRSPGEAFVLVFSYATGKPAPGATVRVLTEDNETLAEVVSDDQGQARLSFDGKAKYLMAELGDDLHALEMDDYGLWLGSYGISYDWSAGRDAVRVLLFSDRPVYRPGETLHLKAIARGWDKNGFKIPAGLEATLRCFDAKNHLFFETNLTLSAMGSCDQSVRLPQGVRGSYRAELKLKHAEFQHEFFVQDFKPNAFELTIKAKPSYAAGEQVELPVTAKYYLGKELTRAKVRWSLFANDAGFAPAEFKDFAFCGEHLRDSDDEPGPGSLHLQGEGVYSDKTNFVFTPEITLNPQAPQPRAVNVFVEMTDLNQQTVSRSVEFTQQSSDFYVGLKRFKNVVRAGQPLPLEAVVVRADGQRWPDPVKARLKPGTDRMAHGAHPGRRARAGVSQRVPPHQCADPGFHHPGQRRIDAGAAAVHSSRGRPLCAPIGKPGCGGPGRCHDHDFLCRWRTGTGLGLSQCRADRIGARPAELRARSDRRNPGENSHQWRRAGDRRARDSETVIHHRPRRERAGSAGAH